MKRIIIALGAVIVLAVGAAVFLNMDHPVVATASGADHVVPKGDVEQHAVKNFPFKGDAPDSVSCPSGLPAKTGAKVSCEATFGKKSKTMEVSADTIDGDDVTLGFALLNH